MNLVTKRAITYRCDNDSSDMDEAKAKEIKDFPNYTITKEEKKQKVKKSKGEIIDEYWNYTITEELCDPEAQSIVAI